MIDVNLTEQYERVLLTEDELQPETLYLSTRDTGFIYFVLAGWSDADTRVVAYADLEGIYPMGFVDVGHRTTTREFYKAPAGTSLEIWNEE